MLQVEILLEIGDNEVFKSIRFEIRLIIEQVGVLVTNQQTGK